MRGSAIDPGVHSDKLTVGDSVFAISSQVFCETCSVRSLHPLFLPGKDDLVKERPHLFFESLSAAVARAVRAACHEHCTSSIHSNR